MPLSRRSAAKLLGAPAILAGVQTVSAAPGNEAYPAKPVRIIVPYPPGGPYDGIPRLIAQWLGAQRGWSIGLTNSVQPYCKLAIITMQMMPKISCPQRVASDAVARDEIASDVLVATVSSIPALLIEQHACPRTP